MTVKTPISNISIEKRLIRNSFLKLSIALKLIIIQIGISNILKEIKNKDKPSTVVIKSPQFN